jgi:hypothetical protein
LRTACLSGSMSLDVTPNSMDTELKPVSTAAWDRR